MSNAISIIGPAQAQRGNDRVGDNDNKGDTAVPTDRGLSMIYEGLESDPVR